MKKAAFLCLFISMQIITACAQKSDSVIIKSEAERIISILASDSMEGRKAGSAGADKAARFIAEEFKQIGLQPIKDSQYLQFFNQGGTRLFNVVGILPGKSKPDELVVFSAHYDHLGIDAQEEGDSIYNGANDDASGTTAIILLAKHFKQLDDNARTLIFAAFTAEESGGYGSQYFSRQCNPDQVVAMFNIEMIGTESKWGANTAFITGFDKSDMGKIMQHNLKDSKFAFHPDPYPQQQLFYRSDNATLARLGVPAHSISTAKMDEEKYYHEPGDEVSTLDLDNMVQIIEAIAESSKSIVNGKDTPKRIKY